MNGPWLHPQLRNAYVANQRTIRKVIDGQWFLKSMSETLNMIIYNNKNVILDRYIECTDAMIVLWPLLSW